MAKTDEKGTVYGLEPLTREQKGFGVDSSSDEHYNPDKKIVESPPLPPRKHKLAAWVLGSIAGITGISFAIAEDAATTPYLVDNPDTTLAIQPGETAWDNETINEIADRHGLDKRKVINDFENINDLKSAGEVSPGTYDAPDYETKASQ